MSRINFSPGTTNKTEQELYQNVGLWEKKRVYFLFTVHKVLCPWGKSQGLAVMSALHVHKHT